MSTLYYDIYFRGECLAGYEPQQVKQQFALLFKAPAEKIQPLFSGKVVVLRRGLDKAGAIKFKQALEKAGAKIYVKAAAPSQTKSTEKTKTTTTHLDVLPVGSDVLSEDERTPFVEAAIDTSHLQLTSAFMEYKEEHEAAPPAPDVSHLSTAEVGADLLESFHDEAIPLPETDTSHISLAEAGAQLSESSAELLAANVPNVEHFSLAEVGSDIDPSPKDEPPPAPDVSHIKLDN